jgi:hypothetical protein
VHNMHERHNEQEAQDRRTAATAQAFLSSEPDIISGINAQIDANKAQIDHIAQVVGPQCMDLIIHGKLEEPKTIDEVVSPKVCPLGKDAVKEATGLYDGLITVGSNLHSYLQPDEYNHDALVKQAENGARAAINDVNDNGIISGLDYNDHELIGIKISDEGVITEETSPPDPYNYFAFGAYTFLTGAYAAGAYASRKHKPALALLSGEEEEKLGSVPVGHFDSLE